MKTKLNPHNFFADYGKSECCIIADYNGIYTTPLVIKLAMEYGFNPQVSGETVINENMSDSDILDVEECFELRDEAENYLSSFLPDDYYFGNFEDSGDVGIVKINNDENL